MTVDKETFLNRWSRLKQEQPAEGPSQVPAAPESDLESAPPLQPVEDLKPDSDFTPFMNPKVDPETRRSALKKLFADAHYNEPDLFEPYSADFTKSEPIPEKMLRAINRVRDVAVKGPEKVAEEERLAEQARLQAEQPAKAAARPQEAEHVPGKQDA